MKIRIESHDGYAYNADTVANWPDSEPAAVGMFKSKAGEALLDLQKQFAEIVKAHPLYEHMEIYPSGILLELDGSLVGIVSMVDDFPQFTTLHMEGPWQKREDGK